MRTAVGLGEVTSLHYTSPGMFTFAVFICSLYKTVRVRIPGDCGQNTHFLTVPVWMTNKNIIKLRQPG